MNKKYLICGAIDQEISLLKDSFDTLVVGVGLIESGITLMEHLSKNSYDQVLFTGTVGAYKHSLLVIGDVVTTHQHVLVGASAVMENSYFPRSMQRELQFDNLFSSDLRDVKCASVIEITKTDELADKIVEVYDVSIEHMELYALASVCNRFNIPFSGIVGVANIVYEHSHVEWLQNNENASENAQNMLASLLK